MTKLHFAYVSVMVRFWKCGSEAQGFVSLNCTKA